MRSLVFSLLSFTSFSAFATDSLSRPGSQEGRFYLNGAAEYNLNLSKQRASAVLNYLTEQGGIGADRLSAVGYGETRPVAANDTNTGKQANRRVSVVVSGSQAVTQKRVD